MGKNWKELKLLLLDYLLRIGSAIPWRISRTKRKYGVFSELDACSMETGTGLTRAIIAVVETFLFPGTHWHNVLLHDISNRKYKEILG
ncbi:hypothetical protein K1719_034296 [Acacia pycnantha]|nr:hypothetical protein K1719_034296 [Acacia pycnantha]